MRLGVRSAACGAALLALTTAACPARAESAADHRAVAAEALFRDARLAMRAGDYGSACPKLAESQRLNPSPGTLLNLGICEEKLGHLATAWACYHGVVDALPAGDPRLVLAQQGLATLDERVPRLRLVTKPGAPSVTLTLDGTALETASVGVAVPVNPGEHVIEVRAPRGTRTVRVTLAESEHRDERLDLDWVTEPPPAPMDGTRGQTTPPSAPGSQSGSGRRTAGYSVAAAGAASLVASIVFGALVIDRKATVASHCTNKVCDPTGLSAGKEGATFDPLATITFATGLAALGAGGYLVLSAPPPSGTRASWGPVLMLHGSF